MVDHFKYLGAYCSADGTNMKELNCRIGKAAGAFKELNTIWKDRYISLPTKMQIYRACVLSTLLYGAECWTLKPTDEGRLDAFDMRCQRKILKIRWSQHVRNLDVRLKTKQPQLTRTIRKRRLQWFGHIQRMNATRLPLRLYKWTPLHGQRKKGRHGKMSSDGTWTPYIPDGPWGTSMVKPSYVRQQVQIRKTLSGR